MPLVEPVTTADLPASCPLMCDSFLAWPQHVDVHDPVLVVRLRALHEPEFPVEAIEVYLRPDAKRLAGPERMRPSNRLGHQLAAQPLAPRGFGRQDAADGGFGKLDAGRHEATVSNEHAILCAEQVPASGVRAVHVLERARLLDHEHRGARLQDGVHLERGELAEGRALPRDHTAAFLLATFARCSQVSTTVSGFRDMDSMPSDISHSARSG